MAAQKRYGFVILALCTQSCGDAGSEGCENGDRLEIRRVIGE